MVNKNNSNKLFINNASLIAGALVGFSLFWEVFAYLFGLRPYWFPRFIENFIWSSYSIGLIIFIIGFLQKKEYNSIKIPAIISIIGFSIVTLEFNLDLLNFNSILIIIDRLSLLIFLIPLLLHEKSTQVKPIILSIIIFVALITIVQPLLFDFFGLISLSNLINEPLMVSAGLSKYSFNSLWNNFPPGIGPLLYLCHWGYYLSLLGLLFKYVELKQDQTKKLSIGGIFTSSYKLGINNFGQIVLAAILWILTCWIPYFNVGTTIAMMGIVVSISKGGTFSPTSIFSSKYRENIGEFFLLSAFMTIGIFMGYAFVIIPGIVITIAWSQALFLSIDKKLNPIEALSTSSRITYGEKMTIFISYLLILFILALTITLCTAIIGYVTGSIEFAMIVGFILYLLSSSIMIGCAAYIYGELNK